MSEHAGEMHPIIKDLVALVAQRLAEPRALTLDHAATYLDCSVRHIRSLLERGELRAVNIGTGGRGTLRIRTEELERFLNERERRRAA